MKQVKGVILDETKTHILVGLSDGKTLLIHKTIERIVTSAKRGVHATEEINTNVDINAAYPPLNETPVNQYRIDLNKIAFKIKSSELVFEYSAGYCTELKKWFINSYVKEYIHGNSATKIRPVSKNSNDDE